jgi:glycosyltransferase involved in cell wall biosynthesis
MKTEQKLKVLMLGDFIAPTGFATVNHNIVDELLKTDKYEITVIGINHWGDPYDRKRWPIDIFPAMMGAPSNDPLRKEPFGRQRTLDFLGTGNFDILFIHQDHFLICEIGEAIIQTREDLIKAGKKPFKWIFYSPIDGILRKEWFDGTFKLADYNATYTKWAKKIVNDMGAQCDYIPLGTNLKDFYPLEDESPENCRKDYFKTSKFVVLNVNRNQPRKDIPRSILAFKKFHDLRPNTFLYLHCNPVDVGCDVIKIASDMGLKLGEDYLVAKQQNFQVSSLNVIYNASDLLISTCLGEGWGLSTTEAFATKLPVIVPNNTSLTEMCADGRGILADSGKEKFMISNADNNQWRPITDVDDMVKKMVDYYDNREKYKDMIQKAYDWSQTLTWESITKQWVEIFDHIFDKQVKVGRNELCKCGSGKKSKKCCSK